MKNIFNYNVHSPTHLAHHGILGQRWGKRNGPPYPLDAKSHSTSERKAGWRRSLNSSGKERHQQRGLSDNQKRLLLVGGAAVAAGIVTYGAYKNGALNPSLIGAGREALKESYGVYTKKLQDLFKENAEGFSNIRDVGRKAQDSANSASERLKNLSKQAKKLQYPSLIHEDIDESLQNTNPLLGEDVGVNNCTSCSIAGILRTMGLNVTGKNVAQKQQNLGGVIEECFKGKMVNGVYKTLIVDSGGTQFCKSRKDAEQLLIKRFGSNAKGVVGITWKGGRSSGHAFSWVIENGKVEFYDFQMKTKNVDSYWRVIDPNAGFIMARLDDWIDQIDYDGLRKWVDFH